MIAQKTGIAELPLHRGPVPPWLFGKMVKLGSRIVTIIIEDYGSHELLRRLSNPFWFQSLSCVLGFDWHSSGTTTVTCAALKEAAAKKGFEIAVCGGKGKFSLTTLNEIGTACSKMGLGERAGTLQYASRMCAKVDSAAMQSGYQLYHHAFFFTEDGSWCIIQQGMNPHDRTARRYHWLSERVKSFVREPHAAMVCDVRRAKVLDMTARQSEECRRVSVELVREGIQRVRRDVALLRPRYQRTLEEFLSGRRVGAEMDVLLMPRRINWNALREAYEVQPRCYEELLAVRGIGPAAVRALALISELIYGAPPSWRDPVKYSFAFGGKNGVPHPVDRRALNEAITFLEGIIKKSGIKAKEKRKALRRLLQLSFSLRAPLACEAEGSHGPTEAGSRAGEAGAGEL